LIISTLPDRPAAVSRRSAPARVLAIGFSIITCSPRSSASSASVTDVALSLKT
jgi:hypothetical protein